MDVGDYIWYITEDSTLPPQKAKILRLDTKTGGDAEYLVRRTSDNQCTILAEADMYNTFEDAKEAKIAYIQTYVDQLQKDIMAIRSLDEASLE